MPAIYDRDRIIADGQFGGGSSTWAPATWHLGISYTTPAKDGSGFSEPTGIGSYARVALTNNTTNFPNAVTASGETTKTNGANIVFPNPTADWHASLPFIYFGYFTASTGGLPQYWFKMDAGITVKSGMTPVQFDAGTLIQRWGRDD